MNAVRLELQRLKARVELLSTENNKYQKEVQDKTVQLEDREMTVSLLKQDVEGEKEKVKTMEKDRTNDYRQFIPVDAMQHEIQGFYSLKSALDEEANKLAALGSMNDRNSTIGERLMKFSDIRSQLMSLVDQTTLEALRLHQELDRGRLASSIGLLLMFLLLIMLGGVIYYLRRLVVVDTTRPTRTFNPYY
jgi:Fe2+ transport system protein B